jgi:hypothetical protein
VPPHPSVPATDSRPISNPPQLPQYSWPEFIAADLSKVCLAEALATSSFDPTKRTFYCIEVGGVYPGMGGGRDTDGGT